MWLPPPDQRGDIHFYFAKSLPYRTRLELAFLLIAAGLAMQVIWLGSLVGVLGIIPVFIGSLSLLSKGYRNRVATKRKVEDWRSVTRKELERIIAIDEKQQQWDRSLIDITCKRGCLTFVFILAIGFITTLCLLDADWPLGIMFALNGAAMVLPFWVTGVRFILKHDDLIIKTRILLDLESAFTAGEAHADEEFQFQMQRAEAREGAGRVPVDVKAVLLFHNAPESFLGLQMQIAINTVQGSSYPYFYCVLVARKNFGLMEKQLIPPLGHVLQEKKQEKDVDLVIIRQHTTRNSGYHTKPKMIRALFTQGVMQCRHVIEQ